MSYTERITKLRRYHRRLLGCTIEYDLAPYQRLLSAIEALTAGLVAKSDAELQAMSAGLAARAGNGEPLDNLLVETYALVRETVWRVLRLQPFDVQIIGALALHQAKLAEMQTGEGKTLAAVFPAFLNALSGAGVHVLTFNDYLARRDAQWMGPVFEFLGLRVAFVQEGMAAVERRNAYRAHITYLTAKEAGFDYLRDSLCRTPADRVHRALNYAIIDEADSILIDEARVPLIIAGAADYYGDSASARPQVLLDMARMARQLETGKDFEFDEYSRNIILTEHGIARVEGLLKCGNLYGDQNNELLARLSYALHAQYLLHLDKDYIIRNARIELVDELTGRVADKRRWPEGLQAALEAKENLTVQPRATILNSITLQHFLQHYAKLSGMTATAQAAESEFRGFYGLHIVVIPPNKPCVRTDYRDSIFTTKAAKQEALLQEIATVHQTGRPILVGTRTVEESAALAEALQRRGVPCEVLNAKRDEFEAAIIAQAGRLGAVTISTNMAGRGTDIRLGGQNEHEKQQVAKLGGLYVIGTNRHESRRIDQQLRGRAGRQGDPGSSRFFVSLEDDLFVKYRIRELLPASLVLDPARTRIDIPAVNREVDRLQRIIEGQHFEIKTTLHRYSLLLEQQRKILLRKREELMAGDAALALLAQHAPDCLPRLTAALDRKALLDICRGVALFHLDRLWSGYLAEVSDIREGIHLRRYGAQDPLHEFHKIIIALFDTLLQDLEQAVVRSISAIRVSGTAVDVSSTGVKTPSATWTYLVNDNPFEDTFQLTADLGHAVFAGLLWPLTAAFLLLKRREKRRKMW